MARRILMIALATVAQFPARRQSGRFRRRSRRSSRANRGRCRSGVRHLSYPSDLVSGDARQCRDRTAGCHPSARAVRWFREGPQLAAQVEAAAALARANSTANRMPIVSCPSAWVRYVQALKRPTPRHDLRLPGFETSRHSDWRHSSHGCRRTVAQRLSVGDRAIEPGLCPAARCGLEPRPRQPAT